jgi:transcription-repair coupling factor (superfamily II helicase)
MDIPNVNTIIINDADKMGLSQLYQLRGRVGRSNRIAYAYLTYRKDKILTEVAEKRLKAIKEFTELGSGFKIAMKDLEIRGAGNMMGSSQHGHMAAIGYDLYCRMLEDTVKLIKGEIDKEPIETTVELKVDAYIPGDYISDEMQKIEVYKKIAAISSYDDMMEIQDELVDRFSDIPLSVENLINIAYIRSIAKSLGIDEIKERNNDLIIQFDSSDYISAELINGLIEKYKKTISFKNEKKPIIIYKIVDLKRDELITKVREVVETMKTSVAIK